MKKLLLLPIVLFVMLIAAMVNPFGCREKKEKTVLKVVGLDSAHWVVEDTLPYWIIIDTSNTVLGKELITVTNYDFVLYDSSGRVATKDSSGWHIRGSCGSALEVFYRSFRMNDSTYKVMIMEKDSIINELLYRKAKQAEYRYAENGKGSTFAFYGKSLAELPDSIIEMLTGSPIAKPDTIFKKQ